ncbi:hypothetical protein FQN53_000765 [Emmonsiellopsis sp. PD_33]|nr:hypothetical protein FQN53_000765 [Emmonsiellopsis sp. PD_33]KAK2793472.1 hypothetical protein FQN51_001229 [Onygenales sp. PD_10]
MCGIFFSLSTVGNKQPDEETIQLLRNRGPDSLQTHTCRLPTPEGNGQYDAGFHTPLYLTYISTVLSLRGDHIQVQPLVDSSSQSVLCWNGEAWKIQGNPVQGNDAERVFQLFLAAIKPSTPSNPPISSSQTTGEFCDEPLGNLVRALSAIAGPFSFVFYDGYRSRIFYGRDCLGRRALLSGWDGEETFKISSVCDGTPSENFEEVTTDGIHMIDLTRIFESPVPESKKLNSLKKRLPITTLEWKNEGASDDDQYFITNHIPPMDRSLPMNDPPILRTVSPSIETLELKLRQSTALRVSNIPETPLFQSKNTSKVAVLYSGGLDCTILARLTHDILPVDQPIDLLNVAFENPRVVAAAAASATVSKTQLPILSTYEACPDRVTGRLSYEELRRTCPNRQWRFVAINIPYTETLNHRNTIRRLMRPHNTEMDLSIACALYFASRGQGEITGDTATVPYTTSARVLLSGLGADEVFAGYTRHATAFDRNGFQGLIDEIGLDVGRLGKRNLGRDDRVISHWGREARFPYLDEDFLAWVLPRPVWEKCGFGSLPSEMLSSSGDAEEQKKGEQSLEPGKRALRLLAWKLGMENVAREKKRAIQFGSRTAKMESGRSKGTHILS